MSDNKYKISIAICTYNRDFYLEKCLASLYSNSAGKMPIEILVIDNNSTDNTKNITDKFIEEHNNLKYVKEEKIGLSHGRNRAIVEAKSEIIAFLDDDVKVSNTYLDRLLWVVENHTFDCLGGMYYPWYLNDKPKWIPDNFGQKEMLLDTIGELKKEYVTGLNMVFTKAILSKVGGFPTNFGMKGNSIGYGEEDYVQLQIRKLDGKIVFDPELYVYHAVLPQKQKLSWHLKSIFINSQTNFLIHRDNENFIQLLYSLTRSILGAIFKQLPIGIYKIIAEKNFYHQNLILLVLEPILRSGGRLKAYFKGCTL